MDSESQKPFACEVDGCGMRFTNEDHLTVHEKKHEMILNLGITSKAASSFVDQTPTPTRLIKNCEDVGLFDDLKHVNPFDETFRRAVESQNNTPSVEVSAVSHSLPDNLLLSENSLHTPQVFPTFDASTCTLPPVENFNQFKVAKQNLILPENIRGKEKNLSKKFKLKKSQLNVSKPASILPNSSLLPKQISLPTTINLLSTAQVITFSIPASAILQSRPIPILPKVEVIAATNCSQSQSEVPIKEKLKTMLNSQKLSTAATSATTFSKAGTQRVYTSMFSNKVKSNPKEIYDDCMERRRKAAMRYRRKIKKEQVDLKRKNAELTTENIQLKAIVKQLKDALFFHQNCDVTNGQRKAPAAQIITAKAAPVH